VSSFSTSTQAGLHASPLKFLWSASFSFFTHRFFQWFILLSVRVAPQRQHHLINAITLEEEQSEVRPNLMRRSRRESEQVRRQAHTTRSKV